MGSAARYTSSLGMQNEVASGGIVFANPETTTSVEGLQRAETTLRIVPNPVTAHSRLVLKQAHRDATLRIVDLEGRLVAQRTGLFGATFDLNLPA